MVDLCSSYESHPSLPAANKHVKKAMIFTREHQEKLTVPNNILIFKSKIFFHLAVVTLAYIDYPVPAI